ncbi:MAG: hypothetical protein R2941_12060 [Desulfobacterales bacterium]
MGSESGSAPLCPGWMPAAGGFCAYAAHRYTDTRYNVEKITTLPAQYSWQVLNWRELPSRELAVSGCDYMTAFRYKRNFNCSKMCFSGTGNWCGVS